MSPAQIALDLLALALAAGAVVDGWLSSSIFKGVRDPIRNRVTYAARCEERPHWWDELRTCGFCLGYHVPYVLGLITIVPGLAFPALAVWFKLPLYALAATRLAWLINRMMPVDVRY